MKRIALSLVILILLVGTAITGCPGGDNVIGNGSSNGSGDGSGDILAPGMSAEEIAVAAIEAMSSGFNTYQFDMDMEMTTTEEISMNMTVGASGAVDMEAMKMFMDMAMGMEMIGLSIQVDMEMYLIDDWMYVKAEMLGMPPEWEKTQAPEGYHDQIVIADQQLDLLPDFVGVELLGTETVNGVECYKLQVTPDMESLWAWAQMQEGTEELEDLDLEEVLTDYSYIEWIATDTYFIVKSIVEMTMAVDLTTLSMTVTTSMDHINEPVTIELPPEAEAAIEVPFG